MGSTIHSLRSRVIEHLGQSVRTGRTLHSPPHSTVREHCKFCKIQPSSDHFKIIDSCPKEDLRILESLFIKKLTPKLNNTVSAFPLNIV